MHGDRDRESSVKQSKEVDRQMERNHALRFAACGLAIATWTGAIQAESAGEFSIPDVSPMDAAQIARLRRLVRYWQASRDNLAAGALERRGTLLA